MANRVLAAALTVLFLAAAFAGAGSAHHDAAVPGSHRTWSTIPDGPYAVLPAVADNLTVSDGVTISYATFMPDVPAGTRVPVILTAGPYFALAEEPVNQPSSQRLSGFLIDNFVSHGYAVVAASVRGTGWSGGCMELMSEREGRDLDELVTFLAQEPWSDGNVAMTGKSYDGGTPWAVARFGNPALKTIVPIAGVSDQGDLLVRRGVAEDRAPIFHSAVYWSYGFGVEALNAGGFNDGRAPEHRAANAACPELGRSTAVAAYTTVTGDKALNPVAAAYWGERAHRDAVIANYEGSAFIVHGLQDWNVNPSQVVPFFNDFPGPKKLLLGQWGHHYPDEGHPWHRGDFAALMKAWFDRELKGQAVATGPVAEVQDARSWAWRSYAAWPAPTKTVRHDLSAGGDLAPPGMGMPFSRTAVTPAGTSFFNKCQDQPTVPYVNEQMPGAAVFSTRVANGFRLSGIGTADVTFEPATSGNVVVVVCEGSRIIARGATNFLYGDGSDTVRPFVPGTATTVHVELEPAEATVPTGRTLVVHVALEDQTMDSNGAGHGVAVVTGGSVTLPAA